MRKLKYLIFILVGFVIGIYNVNASRSVCMYVYGDSTITVNYDYTKKPTYSIDGGLVSSKKKVEAVKDLENDQFFKNGNLVCPVLNSVSRWAHDKHKYTYTLSPIGDAVYGSVEGTLTVLENDGAETGGAETGGVIEDEKIDCIYKKGTSAQYSLRWENGKVVADLTGSAYSNYCKDDTAINQNGFSEEDFKNGKCPDVYETQVNKHQDLGGGCKGKLVISKNSIMTENDVITENDNDEGGVTPDNTNNTDKIFDFCAEDGVLKTFQIVGYLITVIKILVPLLLIIFGSIDFGKAVMAGDDKGIQTATTMLVTRTVGGIIIFFIPTIFHFVTSLISNFGNVKSQFVNCSTCISNTSKCAETRKSVCEGKSTTDKTCKIDTDAGTCVCE